MLKGIVTFYINIEQQKGTENDYMQLMRNVNSELFSKMEESGYGVALVPVANNESNRVEKVDFDRPFPRYILPHIDIQDQEEMLEEVKARALSNSEKE